MWIGFIWIRIGIVAGCCEHGDELSGSIKCGEFPDYLSALRASQEGLYSLEEELVKQQVISPPFMGLEGSLLLCQQEPVTGPYSELGENQSAASHACCLRSKLIFYCHLLTRVKSEILNEDGAVTLKRVCPNIILYINCG
jgi:hypothetical protein